MLANGRKHKIGANFACRQLLGLEIVGGSYPILLGLPYEANFEDKSNKLVTFNHVT